MNQLTLQFHGSCWGFSWLYFPDPEMWSHTCRWRQTTTTFYLVNEKNKKTNMNPAARPLPHGTFHQSNLIRGGCYEAPLIQRDTEYDGIYLVGHPAVLDPTRLGGLFHLDRVAKTKGAQKQLLAFLATQTHQIITIPPFSKPFILTWVVFEAKLHVFMMHFW